MNTAQSDLVIVGAHTPNSQVFWKGHLVQKSDLRLINGVVTLTVPEDPVLVEMQAAGIKIVRGAA